MPDWTPYTGPAGATDDEIWEFRARKHNVYWSGDELPDKLDEAITDITFATYNGYYYCDWTDLVTLFLDLFSIPKEKDSTWINNPQCILEFIPGPLMFRRGWSLLMPHMTPDDWAPTTAAIFADRLRAIRDSKLDDVERAFLVIQPHDLYQVSSCFSLNMSNWSYRDFGAIVWPQALSWDIGSVAAYEDGSVCAATFIYHYIGEFFSINSSNSGSNFHNTFTQLANWLQVTPGIGAPQYCLDDSAPEMQIRIAAAQVGNLLRYCTLPSMVRQNRQQGFTRSSYLQTALQFGACQITNSSTSWVLDTLSTSLHFSCPTLARLVDFKKLGWSASFQSTLRRLEAARQNLSNPESLTIGLDTALSLETYLLSREHVVDALINEYPDATERLRVVLSNQISDAGLPALLRITRQEVDNTKDTAVGFKHQAAVIMAGDSYLGIRSDALALMKVSSDPEHIIQLVLQGHTVQKPLRRSNAVSLTLLFDSSQKFLQVDPQFHAISRDLQRGLEKLLGHKVCKAMGYGDLHLPLTTLANGIIERKAENFNFAAFAMHLATQKKFPDPVREVPPPLARPYGCRQGLMETVDVAVVVFGVLGLVDDAGDSTVPPFSARSVWNLCSRAHRDYFAYDPAMVAAATEAVIYGVIADYLKYDWGPCVDGKNAAAIPPTHLVTGNCDYIKGLNELCEKLEARCIKDNNHHTDLALIPGAHERFVSADPVAARAALEASLTGKRGSGADDSEQKRPRLDAVEVDWFKAAPLQSKPDGFHFGHLVYNLKGMEADAIKSGLISANVAHEVNLFALVVRKVTGNDKRIHEVKKFLPGAIVNFEGRSEDWQQSIQNLYSKINASFYKRDTRQSAQDRSHGDRQTGKGSGKGKGNKGKGNGGRAAAGLLALMPPAAGSVSTNSSKPLAVHLQLDVNDSVPSIALNPRHLPFCPFLEKPTLPISRVMPPSAYAPPIVSKALPWPVQVVNAIKKGSNLLYSGFERIQAGRVAKSTGYLTFLMLSCLLADPAAPNFLLIGDRSGRLMSQLQRKGFRPLVVDPQGCDQPGLVYKGFAEDIAYSRRWRGAIVSTPCDDDALCGSQYFDLKIKNGTHYWGMYLSAFCWCIPADALLFEHPLTVLEKTWRRAHQTVHPYYFGADDNGNCLKKTTLLWVRGWKLIQATNVMQGTPFDYKHAIKDFDPVSRTHRRSEFTWNMAIALVDQCNPDTIIEGAEQPNLSVELALLANNYSKIYGVEALPVGHSNMQGIFPPAFDFTQSQRHRQKIFADAVAHSGRRTPEWPPSLFANPNGDGSVIDVSTVIVTNGSGRHRNPQPLFRSAMECYGPRQNQEVPPPPLPPTAHMRSRDVSRDTAKAAARAESMRTASVDLEAAVQKVARISTSIEEAESNMMLRIANDGNLHWFADGYALQPHAARIQEVTTDEPVHENSGASCMHHTHRSAHIQKSEARVLHWSTRTPEIGLWLSQTLCVQGIREVRSLRTNG